MPPDKTQSKQLSPVTVSGSSKNGKKEAVTTKTVMAELEQLGGGWGGWG